MAEEGALLSPSRQRAEGERTRSLIPSLVDRLGRRAIARRLSGLEAGQLELVDGTGVDRFGTATPDFPVSARVEVHDPEFYRQVAFGGSIGAAESYSDGLWTADDLTAVCRILARNLSSLDAMEGGLARLAWPLWRAAHLLRPNNAGGSRRNIAAHYDLGNEFFELFLDPTMTYSCAIFPSWTSNLETAQVNKLDVICRKLELSSEDRVIEIGSGWGGMAIHAARNYGCRVVTTTISERQHQRTLERVREAGLEDRVEVLRADYRDLPSITGGRFDKLVSIEMIEAVGHRYLPRYFEVIGDLLRPEGLALVQAILIADQRYERYRRSVDFIQRHIFPGSLLPSTARILECTSERTDLRLLDLHDITDSYALTLAEWRKRLLARSSEISALGLPIEFQRMWEFYFAYCEAGFLERTVTDAQFLLAKPLNRTGMSSRS